MAEESRWGGPLPLLCNDDSYQGPPAQDFENSRAAAVVAFAQGVGLGASGGAGASSPAAGKRREGRGDPGDEDLELDADERAGGAGVAGGGDSLWAAWSDAASRGSRPVDFGFLLSRQDSDKEMGDEGTSLHHSPAAEKVKKRPRPTGTTPGGAPVDASSALRPPPCPPRRPKEVLFGKVEGQDRGPDAMDPPAVRTDVFAWMRGASGEASDEVLALLNEENEYAQSAQRHLQPLREQLYREMMAHQKEDDVGLLAPHPGGYGYFVRHFVGKAYQAHCRRRALPGGAWGEEELVLDENEVVIDPADGSRRPYCSVSGPHHNPQHALFTYGTDFAGNDEYTLRVRGFSGKATEYADVELERTDGSVHWMPAGDGFYYVELDTEFRPHRVSAHMLGEDPSGADDTVVFEEPDKRFSVHVCQSGCSRFLFLGCTSAESSEVRVLDLASPDVALRRVALRAFGHQYGADHRGGWLYLLTNKDGTRNYKLCRVPVSALPDVPLDAWEEVWKPHQDTKLDSHHCFKDFVAIQGRECGEPRIYVHGYGDAGGPPLHTVAFPDAATHSGRVLTPRGSQAAKAAFSASLGENHLFDTDVLRYEYSSFTIPGLTYEYHVRSREHRLLRRQEAPKFNPDLYRAERITTPKRRVPISLVYRKDIHPQGLAGGPFPLLLTGYGAYGCCQDPDFCGNRLSLLDRGVVYAVVHVRGGGEFGRQWHEDGKSLCVKNRFADFVEAAETLVALHIAEPRRLAAWGTSSGGLLVAASMNMRPDLFRAVLLEVPFVDVMNTMGDPTVPLTVGEWEEIGNPNERDYFYYMLEYSPYDNIRVEAYPAAMVTACLNDSMVGYWEALKYVSKLRALKTDPRPVLLRVNFHAGHGAASDRYESTRESASHFAFLLDQLGLSGAPLLGGGPAV